MPDNQVVCPNHDRLAAFSSGSLAADEAEQITVHLRQCQACEETVGNLQPSADDFVRQVQQPIADFVGGNVPSGKALGRRLEDAVAKAVALSPLDLPAPSLASRSTADGVSVAGATIGPAGLDQLGQYQLLQKIGEGGMGAVYKARHVKLKKIVAIKVLPADRLKDPAVVARFEREMLALGELSHPNIVAATDAGEDRGIHYLVMEYVQGVDLAAISKKHGPLPIAKACEVVRQAALGLQYAHQQGRVHRDIKPSNLMLAADGKIKILDLGLARLSNQVAPAELTSSGQIMGTVDFMAPEQAASSHGVDIRADIYSLGATLYKLLTGEAVFPPPLFDSTMSKLTALAMRPAPLLSDKRPDAPPELVALVARLLEKDPAVRPATPGEVATALAPFARGSKANSGQPSAISSQPPAVSGRPSAVSGQQSTVAEKATTPRISHSSFILHPSSFILSPRCRLPSSHRPGPDSPLQDSLRRG